MSSDLLKEFGGPPQVSLVEKSTIAETDLEEDDFGDFQDVEEDQPLPTQHAEPSRPAQRLSSENVPDLNGNSSKSNPAEIKVGWGNSTTNNITSGNFLGRQTQNTTSQPEKPLQAALDNNDNDWGDFVDHSVLFDADAVVPEAEAQQTPLNNHGPQLLELRKEAEDSCDGWEPQDTPQEVDDLFDSWEPQDNTHIPITPAKACPVSSVPCVTKPLPKIVKAKDLGPPPSNIPPPSVLLLLIAGILSYLPSKIKGVITSDRASSDPYESLDQSRIDQLRHEITSLRAIARIMAGRKLRWKRDTLLSQSMKIGPAGKQGGMKLAGVDKAESRREDQELAEALNTWKQHVGPLRSTIAMVNVHLPGNGLVVPDISESMPVRLLKPNEGALMAPKCCFLCGLKRDERVFKVDGEVDDSFGEYWTEYWGHVDCVEFWEENKRSLAQR